MMKGNRGSATVIAIVFMLFLLIIGFSWLPLMAQENISARTDWEEQQAWYAAEAGFIQARSELLSQDTNLNWSWLASDSTISELKKKQNLLNDTSDEKKRAFYAVNIKSAEVGALSSSLKPGTYTITSLGIVNGVEKVITREVTVPGKKDEEIMPIDDAIRQWQIDQAGKYDPTDPKNQNLYWAAQKDFWAASDIRDSMGGAVDSLRTLYTKEDIAKLIGSQYILPDEYVWQNNAPNSAYKGQLFLMSATAVMMDGTIGDIQMLVPCKTNTTERGAYAAPILIVEGEVYAWIVGGNRLNDLKTDTYYFGNRSVTIQTYNVTTGVPNTVNRLNQTVEAIQYLGRRDAFKNWNTPADQIAWLKGAILQAGYTRVK